MPDIARQWFIPGEGIDRHVISADIQRYLGNDATVRPGQGTGSDQGIQGYWIKAYRNLTSAMIADLRASSERWKQEQRATGTRGPYEGSNTFHQASGGRLPRREADSPVAESAYQGLPSSRDRMPTDRRAQPVDAMSIDSPAVPQPDRRGYNQSNRGGYPQEPRGFPPAQDSRNYPQDTIMPDTYVRSTVSSSYTAEPRYPSNYPQQATDAGMSSYGRQQQPPPGNYYSTSVPTSYDSIPAMSGRPQDPSQYPGPQYGQPQHPGRQPDHYREQRDQRPDPRDPRYLSRGYETRDPSDAYPSPTATVSSMNARDREPITSPPNPSMYQQPPYQTDPYGRTMQPQPPAPSGYAQPPGRDGYQRERPPPSTGEGRDARRRRH